MTELQIYGKDGLFHQIIKVSAIMSGRYTVLPYGASDLNANNVLSGIELPKDKYPLVACLPPISYLPGTTQSNNGETFQFRLLFLAKTFYSGDNQIKTTDPGTNTSMHSIPMDWNDMKIIATGFMNALEKLTPDLSGMFSVSQKSNWSISRVSNKAVDGVSGVLLSFNANVPLPCDYPDINFSAIILPTAEHLQHFH